MGVLVYCRIRKLTPKECFRLQAFDDFLFDRQGQPVSVMHSSISRLEIQSQ